MRVAHLNMTDTSSQCPAGFRVETANNVSFCIRNTSSAGCQIIAVESFGLSYSQVCGYARGYSYYTPGAFENGPNVPLSGIYVDGISITYDSPPTHIWTYAAGLVESDITPANLHNCPCNAAIDVNTLPVFVGSDYYCESGVHVLSNAKTVWSTNDPLWDGMQCGGVEGPCCNHTGLPWFSKNILTSTTATITTRVCMNQDTNDENIGIEQFELYIK